MSPMLRSFQVTNHRSLAEPQELRLSRGRGPLAVPVTAIHGATAAGKTSVIDALARMRDAVLHSVTGWDPYAGPVRTPHLGFPDRPTEFEAGFVAEGVPYTYGFRLDNADVTAEWLHTHPRSRRRIVFERTESGIRIGPQFEAARFGIAALVPLVRPNALLLSLAGQMYAEALVPAYRWFSALLDVHTGAPEPAAVAHRLGAHLSVSSRNAARLLLAVREAGLGITDVLLAEPDPLYADYLRELDADIAGTAAQVDRCASSPGHAEALAAEHGVTPLMLERELTTLRAAREAMYARMTARRGAGLRTVHAGVDAPFDLTDESASALALLRLLPTVYDALDEGRVLAVDDIDARLSAAQLTRLLDLFRSPDANVRGAQLIFTTADPEILGRRPGAGAAAWRVRRTEQGTSELTAV